MNIVAECRRFEKELIGLRRELHRVPEIGGSLPKTRRIVCNYLDQIGVKYTLNPEDDGLIAEIEGAGAGKTIAFRADMDALHVQEETGLPFASEIPGQMHGCGHDAHTATLLIAAKILNERKDRFRGRVRLLFQSGEETGSGAKEMLKLGAIDGVDGICALHVGNLAGDDFRAGDLIVLPGPVTAGKDKFTFTVHGQGTHSAFPERGVDPILIGARIVNACEEISARELPAGTKAVISFGTFQAGEDHNTIPKTAVLKGSTRVQDDAVRDFIGERLIAIGEHIARAFRGKCDVEVKKGSRTVFNDEKLCLCMQEAIREELGEDAVVTRISSALMGSDDFANYSSRVPGVYFFLHTNNKEKNLVKTNHNPAFDVDEDVLWKGVLAYVATAIRFLK